MTKFFYVPWILDFFLLSPLFDESNILETHYLNLISP
jgi:hypothetical protein